MAGLVCAFLLSVIIPHQGQAASTTFKYRYGVFLDVDIDHDEAKEVAAAITKMDDYRIVVIDAQEFTAEEIETLHEKGHIVWSYMNVGALEEERSDYKTYKSLMIGFYDDWDELWMDTGNATWQKFIVSTLMPQLIAKGVDGFYIDNADVYGADEVEDYLTDDLKLTTANATKRMTAVYNGLITILKAVKATGKYVLLNGGDVFVQKYIENGGKLSDIISAVHQENVFTTHNCGTASSSNTKYFKEYLAKVKELGTPVYMLEYTTSSTTLKTIASYADTNGFIYYASKNKDLKLGRLMGATADSSSIAIAAESIYDKVAVLSKDSYTYNGTYRTPKVTVSGLVSGQDYTVSYANNKKVGLATVTITGRGAYVGVIKKTFKIFPKTPKIRKVKVGSKKFKITMKVKASALGASYYQIAYKVKGSSGYTKVNTTSISKTIKSLKKGKYYKIKVRAYKKVNGVKYYGAWSTSVVSKKIK